MALKDSHEFIKTITFIIPKKGKFQIEDLDIERLYVKESTTPAVFMVAQDDEVIPTHHGKALYKAYAGEKHLLEVEGKHNTQRDEVVLLGIIEFLIEKGR